jgi:hypothetical protein
MNASRKYNVLFAGILAAALTAYAPDARQRQLQ